MDFNIVNIGAFLALVIVYITVRKLVKKFADFTENIGNSSYNEERMETLQAKVNALEEKIKN